MQLNKKIPDANNAKEYYKPVLKSKSKKLGKRSKIITQQPKTIKNPNIDIKWVTVEYPKTCKLSKTKKVLQVGGAGNNYTSLLYSEITKTENVFGETKTVKNIKILNQSYAYKGHLNTYNVEIFNYFHSELQFIYTGSRIRNKPKRFIDWIERV